MTIISTPREHGMKWYDRLTDEELHFRYVWERIKSCSDDFHSIINALAEKWRKSEAAHCNPFSEYIASEGSDITGLPDLERFRTCELLNTRHVHGIIELYPERLYTIIGMDLDDSYAIHYESSHAPMFRNDERAYLPGRF